MHNCSWSQFCLYLFFKCVMQAKKAKDFQVLHSELQGNNNKATGQVLQDTALQYLIQKYTRTQKLSALKAKVSTRYAAFNSSFRESELSNSDCQRERMKIQTSLCFILLHSVGAHEVPGPFSALTILQAPSTHPSNKAAALLALLMAANIPLVMEVPIRTQC